MKWNLVRMPKSKSVRFARTILIVVASMLCQSAYAATQVSQFGITWTFDRDHQVGQFANGDYWVVGPVTIVDIDPASVDIDGRIVHGSMFNPDPAEGGVGKTQAYDSGLEPRGLPYNPSLNVARPNGNDLTALNPLIVQPDSSLVSTISAVPYPFVAGGQRSRPYLLTASVLTVLDSAPATGSFRPAYSGTDKTIKFNKNQITASTYDLFERLPPTPSTPILHKDVYTETDKGFKYRETVERIFERPWLDHTSGWGGEQWMSPLYNMNNLHQIGVDVGTGALSLNLDYTNREKETLLIRIVQLGIDNYGILINGGENHWYGQGGFGRGRLFPILLAGLVFDDVNMKSVTSNLLANGGLYHFGEIDQTFYVTQNDIDTSNSNCDARHGPCIDYQQSDLGLPEWGNAHIGDMTQDNRDWNAIYRTTGGRAGFVLASHIMGIKDMWDYDALFDYMDRYVEIGKDVGGGPGGFVLEMWDAYRADYGCVWARDNPDDTYSNGSNPCISTSDTIPPLSPTNLVSTSQTDSSISLSWTAPNPASDGDSAASYRIFRDANLVGWGAETSFKDTGLAAGTSYSYEVYSVDDAGNQSSSGTTGAFSTLADTIPPSIVSVNALETSVEIGFSEPVKLSTADDINNYTINKGISISGASLAADLMTVTLTTSAHAAGTTYTLTVENVQDTSGNPMTETTTDYEYDDGLVGRWKFDDGSGSSAVDSSGNSNTGTLINGPTWTTGKIDGALSFDGVDDAVEIGTANLNVNSGTITLWAYAESFSSSHHFLFGHATQPWSNRIQLYTDDIEGYLDLGLGDSHARHTNIENLDTQRWYHIALTWDGTNYVVYVDGIAKATGTYTGLSTLETYADIGNNGYSSVRIEAFGGIIDEVRVYNRALSADEVLDLFNEAGSLVFDPIGDKEVDEGSNLTFEVITQDPNIVVDINDHNLPSEPNFFFNGGSWTFSWTPDYNDAGSYEVTFEAPHGDYIDSETITITVNDVNPNLLLSDNFNDGDFAGWSVVDEGSVSGPSSWSAATGTMVQSSNIYSEPTVASELDKLGAYAWYAAGSGWTDYRTTLTMSSEDNDAIGVMFRYQDNDNYYRFSWDSQRSYRRLVKKRDGVFTLLTEDSVPYVTGQSYQLEIIAQGTTLQVSIDGALIFSVTDSGLGSGSIALYTWGNEGGYFDNIVVENLSGGNLAPVISSLTATPSTILDTQTSQLQVVASDPDLGPGALSYSWNVQAGEGSLNNTNTANPVYTPPDVSSTQTFTLTVQVFDGEDTTTSTVDVTVTDADGTVVLLSENFDDGDYTGWNIVDQGHYDSPSSWSASTGTMVQSSNIYSLPTANEVPKLGTYAVYSSGYTWTDYKIILTIRSEDDDAIGVMFRYQDDNNYYRFSWDSQRSYRRLVKKQDGVFTLLAEDSVPYVTGQSYQLEIAAQGTTIQVSIDGTLIFSVTDNSLASGSIALYSWGDQGAYFDNVVVEEDSSPTQTTGLMDNFNDGNFTGWSIVDEGSVSGPSSWSAATGTMVQSSNIYSEPTVASELDKLGAYAWYAAGSGWTDYRTTLTMRSEDNDAIGVMFRYQDNDNYYRFSWDKQRSYRRLVKKQNDVFTLLAEDLVPYVTGQSYQLQIAAQGTTIQVSIDGTLIFSVTDNSLASGSIALYSWGNEGGHFDDIVVEIF